MPSTTNRSSAALLCTAGCALLALACASAAPVPTQPPLVARTVTPQAIRDLEPQLLALYERAEALLNADQGAAAPGTAAARAARRQEVLEHGRRCVALADRAEREQPGHVAPPYYRALCNSLVVRVAGKRLEQLALAKQIERDAREAVRRDERYEEGGPLRLLGMFYVRAPRWPLGPGDADKGMQLLLRARQLFPSAPLNRLFYAEALVAQGEVEAAARELRGLRQAELSPRWRRLIERIHRG